MSKTKKIVIGSVTALVVSIGGFAYYRVELVGRTAIGGRYPCPKKA